MMNVMDNSVDDVIVLEKDVLEVVCSSKNDLVIAKGEDLIHYDIEIGNKCDILKQSDAYKAIVSNEQGLVFAQTDKGWVYIINNLVYTDKFWIQEELSYMKDDKLYTVDYRVFDITY
jgi:hypothetical protein